MASRVLFACVHNAGRSQMAAAFFNAIADEHLARGESGGMQPAGRVHPEVVQVMGEVGIDLSAVRPRPLHQDRADELALLVTMGCGEACPALRASERVDWALSDPKGQPVERVRTIRDEIRRRVEELIARRGWGRGAAGKRHGQE